MNYRRIRIILALLVLVYSNLISQKGIPYISFIESREAYEVKNWSVCQDDHNAMLFASREGILKYDGNEWSKVDCNIIPRSLHKNPSTGTVYILADNQYGYFKRDLRGVNRYISLFSDSTKKYIINDLCFCDSSLVFAGNNRIDIYSALTHKLKTTLFRQEGSRFTGVFQYKDKLYISRENEGLYILNGENLTKSSVADNPLNDIIFSLEHNNEKTLIGLSSGSLFLFDGNNFQPYVISNETYLTDNVLSDGLPLNDTTYVFSTMYGGVILVRKSDGKVLFTLNNDSGLPDDEIYSIGKDHANGLWLTYEYGTCRIDPGLPLRDFSAYPGLEGILTASYWNNDVLYVSTTEGLYYLSEVKNYEDVDVFFRRKVAEEPIESKRSRRKERTEKDGEKRRFLGRLFSREKDPVDDSKNLRRTEQEAEANTKTELVKRTVSKLKSIEYVYEKVKGINSRTEDFLETEQGLLCGASSGLYLVNDYKATLLFRTRNIHHLDRLDDNSYLLGGEEGLFIVRYNEKEWDILTTGIIEPVFSALPIDSSSLWCGCYDLCYKLRYPGTDSLRYSLYSFNNMYPEEMHLDFFNDSLFLISSSGIRYYSVEKDSFMMYSSRGYDPDEYSSLEYYGQSKNAIWLMRDQQMLRFGKEQETNSIWGLFQQINACYSDEKNGTWVVDDFSKIFRIDPSYSTADKLKQEIFVETISNEEGICFSRDNLVLSAGEKFIRIKVTAPSYYKDYSTHYQYRIEDKMEKWSDWKSTSTLDIMTEPGEYRIFIRARNILGGISDPLEVKFEVKTPFYRTYWFYLLQIPVVLAILFLIIRAREKKLRKEKQILEEKVIERTSEIREQKKQIELQKDEILAQKNDITSSITYASRIQHAILPARKIFEKRFSDYFIFFRPRDIVSGDFYWITERKDEVIFAVADCTGHGVPGAFMSMLGNSFLNEITSEKNAQLSASGILDELRAKILAALSQSGEDREAQDGMDIALCIYNKKKSEVQYSGAFNPFYLIRSGEIMEIRADRMPIGFHPKKNHFTNHEIMVKKGDVIYLFSDGFHDQFGGPNGKKFTTKRFKEMLLEISDKEMKNQQDELQLKLDYWQRHYDQVDDMLVLGVRI